MELRSRSVGPWSMNAYVLVCPQTQSSVLVDPGDEPETLFSLLDGTKPAAILVTHAHPDHIGALAEMRRRLQVPVMACGDGILQADGKLFGGERIPVGRHHLNVHATPGHAMDHLCFGVEGQSCILVGDTIFAGGPGKTWSSDAFQITLKTLHQVVRNWPDHTICHPGHGAAFRLGDIRAALEGFLSKDHGQFYGDATWHM